MSLSRTPYYDRHVALDGKIVPFAGYELPVQYPAGLTAEHLQVRRAVGLFDVSHMGEIRVRGPEAADALSWLLSGDVHGMALGEARYHMLCNDKGGVVDDVYAYRVADDEFLVCVNAANRDKDFAWFMQNNRFQNVAIADEGALWSQLAIQGPRAVEVVAALTDSPVTEQASRTFVEAAFAGVPGCLLARTGYTGEDGFEIFIPVSDPGAVDVWDQVLAAGEPLGILPCGLGARDTLRLEARNCLYGHELSDDLTPMQAGLSWTLVMDKEGGFLGADALRAKRGTATHRLVALVVDGKRIPRDHMPITVDGEVVGHVTSGTRSPSLETGIALAYVQHAHAKVGSVVTIDVRGRPAPATVIRGGFLPAV